VKKALDDAQKSHEADENQSKIVIGKNTFALRNIVSQIISPIKKFIEFVDDTVALDPSGHAALPWAGIKFILQVE
jgi:hypothetical protein